MIFGDGIDRRRASLVIAVAQPACVPYDVAANAVAHAAMVRRAGARVVVFPELSLTGYELDAPVVDPGDTRLEPLVAACLATGSVALAGAPVAGDAASDAGAPTGRPYIGMLAVDRAGAHVAYRKMFLGPAEAARFAAGSGPAVITVDGWRLGLAICKDTGELRHARDTSGLGIDAYVAGAVESADDADVQPERARRIATRHGVWVAVASFAGPTGDGFERTAGRSGVWAPGGALVARATADIGDVASATLR